MDPFEVVWSLPLHWHCFRICLGQLSMNLVRLAPQDVINSVVESSRRTSQKCQRPTELILRRPASATPYHGRRPPDVSTPPPSEHIEFNQLKEILLKKSGDLCYNFERITATKDDFIDEGQLGAGTCGVVKKMRHKVRKDLVMAVKQMHVSSTCAVENKRIMMDLDVVTKCVGCPNIVKCMGIFFSMSEVWICMEVMSTSLDNLMRDTAEPFPEYVLGKIAVSIVKALDYLKREHNMMHRGMLYFLCTLVPDVKPSNMLLSSTGDIKLCDFGISGQLKDSIANSNQLGCIGYMAPERLEKFKYDVRADIWSLGISLVELALKSFPYKGSQFEFAILSKIIEEPPPKLPNDGRYSADFCSFVDRCLIKDYVQRPKYGALRKANLFLTYNREPFDVGDWYRTVRLNPTGNHNEGRHTPISPSSSTVTLSPDGNRSWLDSEIDVRRSNQRETSLTRRSPAPLLFDPPAHLLRKDCIPNWQKPLVYNSARSQTLPPPGVSSYRQASPTPPPLLNAIERPGVLGFNSSGGGDSPENVILRNRSRPRVSSGRKHQEASEMVPSVAVDVRRNAFYPRLGTNDIGGDAGDSPCGHSTTNTTTLQAYLNSLNQQQVPQTAPSPPLTYYTEPRSSHQRPSILPPSSSPSSIVTPPHQPYIPNATAMEQNGHDSLSPRPLRSVSAGYNGNGRRIQRAPACRLISNPYQPTRVVNNDTPVFSFSPSKKTTATQPVVSTPSSTDSASGGASENEAQEYHHEYFWYAHQRLNPPSP
ncbi:dual specificity mitogen activated protein [Echinococcus multilocularis]|uniref:Dual specificity mitogen activated protein n=1 Tax=Echinococcus multilocularis TaxID=6211 RepID=A0A087VZ11_ECHMU|nr:dual specificity mitogen activated protein [Echinococcus multilocularis]